MLQLLESGDSVMMLESGDSVMMLESGDSVMMLESGDSVMMDNGFTLEAEMKDVGANLVIPHF